MSMLEDPFGEFFRKMLRYFWVADREHMDMVKWCDFRDLKCGPSMPWFRIEIGKTGEGTPRVVVKIIGEPQNRRLSRASTAHAKASKPSMKPHGAIKKMLETNVCRVERPSEIVIAMEAQGVREDDVEVRRVGGTVEAIARKPTGEAYFCAVELPKNARLDERRIELKEGMLKITIPRRSV
ncbi:MAG: Hsp20/alpha crystallin family protein [Candidatus Hadarchaeales archaeon]